MTILKLTSWVVGHKPVNFEAKKLPGITELARVESIPRQNTEPPIQSGPEKFFGHCELELCETQGNVAVLIELC